MEEAGVVTTGTDAVEVESADVEMVVTVVPAIVSLKVVDVSGVVLADAVESQPPGALLQSPFLMTTQ